MVSASVAVPPWVEEHSVGDMYADVVAFPELGVAPLIASGTDLEDKLPTPADSPVSVVIRSAVAAVPEVGPALKGGSDLELAKALLDVSMMPMMTTPIVDPVVDSIVSPAAFKCLPFLLCWWTNQYLCWRLLLFRRWLLVRFGSALPYSWRHLLALVMGRSPPRYRRRYG